MVVCKSLHFDYLLFLFASSFCEFGAYLARNEPDKTLCRALIFCRCSFRQNSKCSLVWNFRKQIGNRIQNEQTKEEPFVSFQL